MIRITRADTMAASAPCAKATAFLCLGHVVVQKSSPIEVDDERG